jgi:hypothetical protein
MLKANVNADLQLKNSEKTLQMYWYNKLECVLLEDTSILGLFHVSEIVLGILNCS